MPELCKFSEDLTVQGVTTEKYYMYPFRQTAIYQATMNAFSYLHHPT